ncbi:MAG TPA: GyrI-like domain-containing protein [Gammaproteobacteria bacterium]|nr:GyrI-like domain-containing protein [Gammaproteobacteria bacterium]
MSASTVVRRELDPQPILFMRGRVSRRELPAALGRCLGAVYAHCQQAGVAIAGVPFCRYPAMGPGLLTFEAGMPVASAVAGDGEIEAGLLQGGPAAVAVHAGAYENLADTYALIERWLAESGLHPGGPPWESYVTDPADYPDPADWRTEVCWPIA